MTDRTLTPKQRDFVLAYAACGNATEAARQAGYKKPLQQGSENLEKPGIQHAIAELTKDRQGKLIASAEERQAYWTKAMRGELEGYEPKDQLKASELLGKAQGDFIIRHEITDPMRLVVYLPDNGRDKAETS